MSADDPRWRWAAIITPLRHDAPTLDLTASEHHLALTLLQFMSPDGVCQPGERRLAAVTGLHAETVINAGRRLEARGLLEITRVSRRPNRYRAVVSVRGMEIHGARNGDTPDDDPSEALRGMEIHGARNEWSGARNGETEPTNQRQSEAMEEGEEVCRRTDDRTSASAAAGSPPTDKSLPRVGDTTLPTIDETRRVAALLAKWKQPTWPRGKTFKANDAEVVRSVVERWTEGRSDLEIISAIRSMDWTKVAYPTRLFPVKIRNATDADFDPGPELVALVEARKRWARYAEAFTAWNCSLRVFPPDDPFGLIDDWVMGRRPIPDDFDKATTIARQNLARRRLPVNEFPWPMIDLYDEIGANGVSAAIEEWRVWEEAQKPFDPACLLPPPVVPS